MLLLLSGGIHDTGSGETMLQYTLTQYNIHAPGTPPNQLQHKCPNICYTQYNIHAPGTPPNQPQHISVSQFCYTQYNIHAPGTPPNQPQHMSVSQYCYTQYIHSCSRYSNQSASTYTCPSTATHSIHIHAPGIPTNQPQHICVPVLLSTSLYLVLTCMISLT